MNGNKYIKMLLRRRFCKRVVVVLTAFILSYFIPELLFGKGLQILDLIDLNRCPACYGVSVCPELYSNQIMLGSSHWSKLFNAKNIYYGYTKSNRKVLFKKLAHNWELREFDSNLCNSWNLDPDCKPVDLLQVPNIEKKIKSLVEYNLTGPNIQPRKGLTICPYAYSIYDFIKPIVNNENDKLEMLNIWTMLSVNPEPIILQIIPKSQGWPVPAYAGVCGRIEVVADEGEPLSSLLDKPWHKKLVYAQKILMAALDFTFKHDRFRFYLMDWSIDNIVANELDEISFVDLEDMIVLDKHISPKTDLMQWHKRDTRDNATPGFTFSIENICSSYFSDHNLWAACYVLAGSENPLILPIPEEVNETKVHLKDLFNKCLNGDNRFTTINKLVQLIDEIVTESNVDTSASR